MAILGSTVHGLLAQTPSRLDIRVHPSYGWSSLSLKVQGLSLTVITSLEMNTVIYETGASLRVLHFPSPSGVHSLLPYTIKVISCAAELQLVLCSLEKQRKTLSLPLHFVYAMSEFS
ncbi:hypothetical protein WUBG_17023, partial [Wuchereria bancrofti]